MKRMSPPTTRPRGSTKNILAALMMCCAFALALAPTALAAVPLDTAPDIVAVNCDVGSPAIMNAAALKTTIAQEASTALVPCDVGLAITANTSAGYNTDVGALLGRESEGSASAATIVGDMLNLANIAIYFDTGTAENDTSNEAANTGADGTILANNAAHTIGSPSTEAGASTTANTDAQPANAEKDVGAGVLNA